MLSTTCKDLFPIIDIMKEICTVLEVHLHDIANMQIKIHKDNAGALTLGRLEPHCMTPRSKHYAVKYHWFCTQISSRNVELVKIGTNDQIGDFFTKGLDGTKFRWLQKKHMGW